MKEKNSPLKSKLLLFIDQVQNSLIDQVSKENFQKYLQSLLNKMNDDNKNKNKFIKSLLDIYKEFFEQEKQKDLLAIQLVIYSLCQNIKNPDQYIQLLQQLTDRIQNFDQKIIQNMKYEFLDEDQIKNYTNLEQFQERDYLKLNVIMFYKLVTFLDLNGQNFQDLLQEFENIENLIQLEKILSKKFDFHIERELYDYFNNNFFDLDLQFLDLDKGITEQKLAEIERKKIYKLIQKNEQNFQQFFQQYLNYSKIIGLVEKGLLQNLEQISDDKKQFFEQEGSFLIFLNKQIDNIGSTNDKFPQQNIEQIKDYYIKQFSQNIETHNQNQNSQQQKIKIKRQSMQNVKSDINEYQFKNKYFHKTKSITIGKQIEIDELDNSSQTIDIDQFDDFNQESDFQDEEISKKQQIFDKKENKSHAKTFLDHFQNPDNQPEQVIYKIYGGAQNQSTQFEGFKNHRDQLSDIEKISGRSSFIGKSALIFYGKDRKSKIDIGQSQISKNSSQRMILRNFLNNSRQTRLQNELKPIGSKQRNDLCVSQQNFTSLPNNNINIQIKKLPQVQTQKQQKSNLLVNKSKSMQKGLQQFQNFEFKNEEQDQELFKTETVQKKKTEPQGLDIQDFQTDSEYQTNTEIFNEFNNSQVENNFDFQEQILPPSVVQKPIQSKTLSQKSFQNKMNQSEFQQKLDNLQNNIKKTQNLFQELEMNQNLQNQQEVIQNIKENFELMNFLYFHKDYHQQTIFSLNNELTQLKDEIIAKNEIQNSLQNDLNFKTEKLFMMKKDLQKIEVIAQIRKKGLEKWKKVGLKLKKFLNGDIKLYKQHIGQGFQDLHRFLNHITNKKNKTEIKFQFQQQKNRANSNEIQILKQQKFELQKENQQKNQQIHNINQKYDKLQFDCQQKLNNMQCSIQIFKQQFNKINSDDDIVLCKRLLSNIKNNLFLKKGKIQQLEFLKKEAQQYKHRINVQHIQNQSLKEKLIDYEDQLRSLKIKHDQKKTKDSLINFQSQVNKKELQQEKISLLKDEFDEKINEIIEQKQKIEEENLLLFEQNQRLKSKFPTDRFLQNIQDLENENEKLFEENQNQLKELQYMKTGPNSYDILKNKVINYEQTLENLKLNYKRNSNKKQNIFNTSQILNTKSKINNSIPYNQNLQKNNTTYQSQFSQNNGLKGTAFLKKFQVYIDIDQQQNKSKKTKNNLTNFWKQAYNKDLISQQAISNNYMFFNQNSLQINIEENIVNYQGNFIVGLDLYIKNLSNQIKYIFNLQLEGDKKLYKEIKQESNNFEFRVQPFETKIIQIKFQLESSYIIKNQPLFISFALLNQIQMDNLSNKKNLQIEQYFHKNLLPLTINKFFEYIEEKVETFNLIKKLVKVGEIVLERQKIQLNQIFNIFPKNIEISSVLNVKSYGTKIKTIFGNNLVVILLNDNHIKIEIYSIQKNTVNQLYYETLKIIVEYLQNL